MTRFNRRHVLHLMWTVVLLALLIAASLLNRSTAPRPVQSASETNGIDRFGFTLEEIAKRAGVDVVHEAPTFDQQFDHIMPQIASTGAAVAVADFDRDGWQDFYLTNSALGSLNRLYRNRGDGTFADVAGEMGLAAVNQPGSGVSMGAVWGDFDNDGYEDLFLYKYGRPELFRNMGGKSFVAAGAKSGLPEWVNANSAVWFDYDRDGWLDLFVAGYWPYNVDLSNLATTRVMPESFEYAENGGRKYLFRNRRDGTFEELSARLGINSRRWTLAVVAADLLNDGYPDLFLANDYGVSQIYANRDGKRFDDVSRETGVGMTPKSGMSASVGDIFNDGRLSIYKSNISEPGVLVQGNDLWVPKLDDSTSQHENLASSIGVDLGGWSWGAQFGDLNNDGWVDLYLVNGYVSAGEQSSYWYDFSVIAVGHSAIIADAKNWPPMRGRSLSGYQRKRVWLNDGFGRFTEVAQIVGATDTYDGRAVALADLWNSGSLDVIVANQRGPLLIYKNTVRPDRHWVAFDLEGSISNRSAIGTRVELQWNDHRQTQEISGGSGFSAQNQRRLHFGLGTATVVERAVIRWPSGLTQVVERPTMNQLHKVTEPR